MYISFGRNAYDTTPRGREVSFEQFAALCAGRRHHGFLSAAQYVAADRTARSKDKDGPWFIPGRFVPNLRLTEHLVSLVGFACDFDSGVICRGDIEAVFSESGPLAHCQFVAWTSYSHGVGRKERWRVFIPYAEPVSPDRHRALYEHFNAIFQGQLDASCAKPAQFWYLPGCPTDAEVIAACFRSGPDAAPFSPGAVAAAVLPGGRSEGLGDEPAIPRALSGSVGRDANDDLTEGVGYAPPTPQELVEWCAALLATPENRAHYGQYDHWLAIGIALHRATEGSEVGRRIWDRWSRHLAGYDPGAIESKWSSINPRVGGITVGTLKHLARQAGWTPAPSSASGVSSDLHAPAGALLPSSGLTAAVAACPAQSVSPVGLPAGWKNATNTLAILQEKQSEDGTNTQWVRVIDNYRLLRIESLEKLDDGTGAVEIEMEKAGGTIVARISGGELGPGDLGNAVRGRGIYLKQKEIVAFQELLMDYLKKVQNERREKYTVSRMGWIAPKGEIIGFAAGTSVYYSSGRVDNDAVILDSSSTHGRQYAPAGELAPWKQVADFIAKQGQMPLVTILASAFASPLVRLTGLSGAVLSIVSTKSGVGKSSAMQTAQAVWGARDAMHSTDDTNLSFTNKMGATNNLPVYWDDIKGEAVFQKLPDLVFQITQGREKARLDSAAKLRETKSWDTLATFAANDSIVELMRVHDSGNGSDATLARIFELRLEDRPIEDRQPPAFFDAVRTNYGQAGAVYAKALAANHVKIKQALLKKHSALEAELQVPSEERFWVMVVACLVTGAALAKGLGLVEFDPAALETYLKEQLKGMRGVKTAAVAAKSAKEIIADMVGDMTPDTLVVTEFQKQGASTELSVVRPPATGIRGLRAALASNTSVLRVRMSCFNDWMKEKRQNADSVLRELRAKEAVAEKLLRDLGAGTAFRQYNKVRCYDIDLKRLGL